MARTKAKARRGAEGREYQGNAKTEEGRKLNQENKKLKQQARKVTKAAKRAKIAKGGDASPQNPAAKGGKGNIQGAEDETRRVEEGDGSIQPDAADRPRVNASNETSSMNTSSVTIDPNLAKSHELTTMSILSSSHIQQKVTRALSLLSVYPAISSAKPAVVMLHAKGKAAAKMISIAEIVKREIAGMGGKWFQYNQVEQVMEEKKSSPPKEKENSNTKGKEKDGEDVDEEVGDHDQSDEEEGAFETMKTPFERAIEGTAKVRAVPIMTIYLSRVRNESLRREYG